MSPQSGNGSQGDSWAGRGSGRGSPPDLGELFRQGKDQFGQMLPGGSTRGFLMIALLLLIGVAAWSAYYTVPRHSVSNHDIGLSETP
jgi:membrane protease subunit HflK